MHYLTLLFVLCYATLTNGQVVWSENFDSYADGTTSGTNNNNSNPNSDWESVCPNSAAATDYFQVMNGVLEGRDTNGDAFWTSEDIDISGCPTGVIVSMDLSHLGDMEGCNACASSCNCTDGIRVETNVDGAGFVDYTSPAGGPCNQISCASGNYIALGEFNDFTFSTGCLVGSSLQIRVSVQTWAGTEYLMVDNIAVNCSGGACNLLSVSPDNFRATQLPKAVELEWSALPENNYLDFEVEKSADALSFSSIAVVEGDPVASEVIEYKVLDDDPLYGMSYYRLKSTNTANEVAFSPIVAVERDLPTVPCVVYPNPAHQIATVQLSASVEFLQIEVLDIWGRSHLLKSRTHSHQLTWDTSVLPAGYYTIIVTTPNQTLYRSLIVQH